MYGYVENNPMGAIDTLGLSGGTARPACPPGQSLVYNYTLLGFPDQSSCAQKLYDDALKGAPFLNNIPSLGFYLGFGGGVIAGLSGKAAVAKGAGVIGASAMAGVTIGKDSAWSMYFTICGLSHCVCPQKAKSATSPKP